MTVPVVDAHKLGKLYKIYPSPWDRFMPGSRSRNHKDLWAVRSVNINVAKGQCLGVIGLNGAGKSTLLKLLTGVLQPTTGSLTMNGEVLALLELGTGFNGEVSGRQNVFLTGAMLGYPQTLIAAKVQAIQDFADIGDYFEQPVKTYSSGMFVRLAFSLYVNLDPEILIVDEALSVGDFFFQQKCATAIRTLKERGTTILFVSHDSAAVHELCDEVILLDHGRVLVRGDANSVIGRYHTLSSSSRPGLVESASRNESSAAITIETSLKARIEAIKADDVLAGFAAVVTPQASLVALRMLDETGTPTNRFPSGSVLRMEAVVEAHHAIAHANFGVLLADDQDRAVWSAATSNQDVWFGPMTKSDLIVVCMNLTLDLPPGRYTFNVATGEVDPYDAAFVVWNDTRLKGLTIDVLASDLFADRSGIAYLGMAICAL